ncbi:MAG: cobalamin B12-binding domain-containing protein [Chloroflexi bacterium]|nr:cobalamin B12-binding domain-containing protein [Chloroflexota bacterium]
MAEKIRVLVAKPGLDGHDLGAKYVARALRDAGMEVIYTGLQQTAEQIAAAAIQEDVDIIGCSILCGAHLGIMDKVMKKLKEEGVDAPVMVGGCIPRADIAALKAMDVAEVFPTDSPLEKIVAFIKGRVEK